MKPVLFTSQRPLNRAENIKAVFEAYDDPKVFAQLDWFRQSAEITSGKYDLMVTDEIPVASPGKVVMINHGISGTKLYGLDQTHRYATQEQCDLINYVITQSPDLISQVAQQQGVEEWQVIPLGMPRTDAYFKPVEKAVKTVYFFAPTYRSAHEASNVDIDWRKIDSLLQDDEVMLVKPHMLTNTTLNGNFKHIFAVSNREPSSPYIVGCNVLVTDFSSIMMDGLVAHKPVVLFSKDNGYLQSRGMYFKYPDEYSCYYADSEEALVSTVRNAKWNTFLEDRRDFFVPTCDGHSTERVVNFIRRVAYDKDTYCSSNI